MTENTGTATTWRVPRELSVGESALLDRLHDEREEIEKLTRSLAAAKRRRRALILKARRAGMPLRFIARHAGVSNVRISQIERTTP